MLTLQAEIRQLEDRAVESDRRVAMLAVRERTVDEREAALNVREAALNAQHAMLRLGSGEAARPHSNVGGYDPGQQHIESYYSQLVQLEATLHEAHIELTRQTMDMQRRAITLRKAETDAAHLQASAEELDQRTRSRAEAFERDLAERNAEQLAATALAKRELARLSELDKVLQDKQRDLAAREASVAIQSSENIAKEKKLATQAEHIAKEKELCKKLSDELLRREGAVRAAEKGINAARGQLKALEDEVATRVRRVSDDQSALKRWAEELDRRDADVTAAQRRLRAAMTASNQDAANIGNAL